MKSIARLSWLTIFLMLTACIPASSYRGTPVSQTMQSAEIPGNELCDLEMLTPSVQWQRELDDIRLILTIYNYSELRCQLV